MRRGRLSDSDNVPVYCYQTSYKDRGFIGVFSCGGCLCVGAIVFEKVLSCLKSVSVFALRNACCGTEKVDVKENRCRVNEKVTWKMYLERCGTRA